MIKLQIDGQFLDMNEKTALNISINSPFFSTDTIAGSTVYDFTIPFSDRNNLIFGFSNIETIRTVKQSFPVHIYHNGSPYKEGVLYIKTISNAYNCYISMDAGLLKEAIADKDLSDLPLDPLVIEDVKIDADYPFVTLRAEQGFRYQPFYTLLISRTNGTDFYSNKYKIENTFSTPGIGEPAIPVVYFLEKFKNLINQGGYVKRFSPSQEYRIGSKFQIVSYDSKGYPIYAPTAFSRKYFWIIKDGVQKLIIVKGPNTANGVRIQLTEDSLFPSWWSQNYISEIPDNFESNAPFNGIDEESGWFKNIHNLRASIVGEPVWPVLEQSTIDPDVDEAGWLAETEAFEAAYAVAYAAALLVYEACTDIKIEDLSNANPHHLSIDSPFGFIRTYSSGTNWQVVDSYTEPIIEGFDPNKIAARLKETTTKTYPDENFVVSPVRNEKFLDDSDYEFYQNNIDEDSNLILNSNTAGTRNRNVFTAFPYNNYVLEEIFKLSGLKLYGGLLTNPELATVCLWNNFSNDMVLVDELDATNQLRVPSTVIDLRQNLKGTSIKNFLYANRKTFGVDFFYRSNGSVECIFKKAVALSTDAEDWSSKEIPEAEIFIEDEINGFSFLPSSDTDGYYSSVVKSEDSYQIADDVETLAILEAIQNDPINTIRGVLSDLEGIYIKLYRCTYKSNYTRTWVFHGLKIPSVILGDGQNNVQSEIGVPLMYHDNEGELRPSWNIPRVDSEGRSLFALEEKQPSGLKFMLYRGITNFIWDNGNIVENDTFPSEWTILAPTVIFGINSVTMTKITDDTAISKGIISKNGYGFRLTLTVTVLANASGDAFGVNINGTFRYGSSSGTHTFTVDPFEGTGLDETILFAIFPVNIGDSILVENLSIHELKYVQLPSLATTADNLAPSSNNYSLHIVGENNYYEDAAHSNEAKGTYQTHWADWCKMMLSARKVKKRWILTPLDILQLDLSIKKYANGKTYLIQKTDFEIGESETIIATTECWRL